MTKVGINGFGRIGGFRVAFNNPEVEVVAMPLDDVKTLAHLLKYDSIHGIFNHEISIEGNFIIVDGHKIEVFSCMDPAKFLGAKLVLKSL